MRGKQIPDEYNQSQRPGQVEIHGHLACKEPLAKRAEHLLSDRHDYAGIKRKPTLPEEQGDQG